MVRRPPPALPKGQWPKSEVRRIDPATLTPEALAALTANVPVTKCPDGAVEGAGDLYAWASTALKHGEIGACGEGAPGGAAFFRFAITLSSFP